MPDPEDHDLRMAHGRALMDQPPAERPTAPQGPPDVTVEVHVLDDANPLADILNKLRAARAAREDDRPLPDLTLPMEDIWVCVSINETGEQRIMTTPQGMPMLTPSADILPTIRELVGALQIGSERIEIRRFHLAETEDITPEREQ